MTTYTLDNVTTGGLGTGINAGYVGQPGVTSGSNASCLIHCNVTYVDSASGFSVPEFIPSSTYTVGDRYPLSVDQGGLTTVIGYHECVTTGTVGASKGFYTAGLGYRYTYSGTAVFAFRRFTSWGRAFRGALGSLGYNAYRLGLHTYSISTISPTILIASGSVFQWNTVTTDYGLLFNVPDSLSTLSYPNRLNFVETNVISASKAAWPATTFAAGALSRRTVNTSNFNQNETVFTLWTASTPRGNFRGLSFTQDYTPQTSQEHSYYQDDSVGHTFYDCLFSSGREQGSGLGGLKGDYWPVASLFRHATRCTVRNTSTAVTASALVGGTKSLSSGGGIGGIDFGGYATLAAGVQSRFDACTYTRTQAGVTNPIFSHTQWKTEFTLPYLTYDPVYIFGGDVSAISSKLTGITTADWVLLMYDRRAAALVTYGVKANTASYPVTPNQECQPTHWNLLDGTVGAADVAPVNSYPISADAVIQLTRESTIYRTGSGGDGIGAFSFKALLSAQTPLFEYDYYFHNPKVDGSYTITHEINFSNTTGSGLTALNTEDVMLTVVYPSDPNTQETAWATSSPDPQIGLSPTLSAVSLPTSTTAWTGTVTNSVKHKVSVTISPRNIGPVYVLVTVRLSPRTANLLTVTSLTVYLDPIPVIT